MSPSTLSGGDTATVTLTGGPASAHVRVELREGPTSGSPGPVLRDYGADVLSETGGLLREYTVPPGLPAGPASFWCEQEPATVIVAAADVTLTGTP